jgi:hypothetical protein
MRDTGKEFAEYLGTITKRTVKGLRLSEVAELGSKAQAIADSERRWVRPVSSVRPWWVRKYKMLDAEYLRRLDSAIAGVEEFDTVRLENAPGSTYRYHVDTTEPGNVRTLAWGGQWPPTPSESPQDAKKEAA